MSQSDDQHNSGGFWAFILSMAFVGVFFIYIAFIHPGIDLKENIKDPAEIAAAKLAESSIDVSKITEPWVPNEMMARYGKKLFTANCSMCHGPEGKGDGAAGASLNPKPRNLVEGPWKKGGGYIGWFTVLQEGLPGGNMVSFKQLKPFDRWALVQFIGSITQAKVTEDPAKVAEFAKTAQ